MTIQAEQLIAPRGRIPATMFPELERDELETQLTAYIAEGETKAVDVDPTKQDEAVTRWAEYRAFDAAYVAALNTPIEASTDDVGSHSFNMKQIGELKTLSLDAKASFDALVPLPVVANVQPAGNVAVPTVFRW